MNFPLKKNDANGFSLVSIIIGLAVTVILSVFIFKTFHLAHIADRHLQGKSDLNSLQNMALRMIDCKRSVSDSPTCQLKDKSGARWPSANGRSGDWEVTSSCNGSSIVVQRRYVGPKDQLISADQSQWLPLFPSKPGMCDEQFPPPNLPYYVQVNLAVTPSGAQDCLWGGKDPPATGEYGYSHDGIAYCPAGYHVINGGATCGTESNSGPSAILWSYRVTNAGLEGWSVRCCSESIGTGNVVALCIRNF